MNLSENVYKAVSGACALLLFTDEVCVYIQAHETLCTLRFSSLISQCELGKATKHISLDKDSEVRHATKSHFFYGSLHRAPFHGVI